MVNRTACIPSGPGVFRGLIWRTAWRIFFFHWPWFCYHHLVYPYRKVRLGTIMFASFLNLLWNSEVITYKISFLASASFRINPLFSIYNFVVFYSSHSLKILVFLSPRSVQFFCTRRVLYISCSGSFLILLWRSFSCIHNILLWGSWISFNWVSFRCCFNRLNSLYRSFIQFSLYTLFE